MRVLLTGHQGYIGTVLAPMLRAAGHDVTGVDAGLFADCVLGPAVDDPPTLPIDVRDLTPAHCRGFDAVLHLAAICNDTMGDIDPALTQDVNYRATVRLARTAKTAGVSRFLFSSSCSVYGPGRDDALLTESAGLAPITPYAESKIRAERALMALADDDFSPVMLRNATAYGYSPRLRGDLAVNDLTAHAMLTGQVRLLSDGSAWRPLAHVEDIAGAFLALLSAPRERVHARVYNVGDTAENYRIRTVAEIVADVLPGSRITFAGGRVTDQRNYRVSCDRLAADVPGFQPRWTVRRGVAQLVEAYRTYGLTLGAFTGERHQRIQRIQALRAAGRLDSGLRWTTDRQHTSARWPANAST
ncbi:MAG TPA: NAD(P)-dependent oxidoreductase [Micromonosporaceae bacterium]|nr:NAD(P)-dependent oxidoreductase [Micromonosporaceae bacterium]